METSQELDRIAEALSRTQGQLRPAVFDRENPLFKNRYATLNALAEAARPALAANGIALVQTPIVETDPFRVGVTTLLLHVSGQWIRGNLFLQPQRQDPQAVGSALTYARRYSLAAMVGIVSEEDDDAEMTIGRSGNGTSDDFPDKPSRTIRKVTESKSNLDKSTITPAALPPKNERLTKMREIFALSSRLNQSPALMKGYIGELLGRAPIASSEEIPDDKLDIVLARFREEVGKLGQEAKAA